MASSGNKKSFLDLFKMSNNNTDYDDDLFDEDDEADDYDDYDDYDETPSYSSQSYAKPASSSQSYAKKTKPSKTSKSSANSKLVPINSNRSQYGSQQVFVIKPEEFDDAQMIIDHLNGGQATVVNMEGMELQTAQRIIDFIAGACYSIDGSLQAISGNIFIAAPSGVYVSGDLREELLNEAFLSPDLGNY